MDPALDYGSTSYKQAYGRLTGAVIEGEQEAYGNYLKLAKLMPQHQAEFLDAARIERRHQRSFQSCSRNLGVNADRSWAKEVFAELRDRFSTAAAAGNLVPCLLIQALVVECLAIATYNAYIPVADDFSRKVAETVIQDEYQHLNFGQSWFKQNFESLRAEIQAANQTILPIAHRILARISYDAAHMGMDLQSLEEEFTIRYGEALEEIGFSFDEVYRMAASRSLAA